MKGNSKKLASKRKSENVLHVKLDYEDSVEGKRGILSSEKSLLRIKRTIKDYRELRVKELKLKLAIAHKMKELIEITKKMDEFLPKTQFPGTIKKNAKVLIEKPFEKEDKAEERIVKRKYDDDIETQLKEIQKKLNSLKI